MIKDNGIERTKNKSQDSFHLSFLIVPAIIIQYCDSTSLLAEIIVTFTSLKVK
jgi:hypothetical protein